MDKYNHTCLNPNCPNKIIGADGKPQNNYYACNECDRSRGITWRSVCCSKECFNEFVDIYYSDKSKSKKSQEVTATKNTDDKSAQDKKSQKKNISKQK